VLFSLTREKFNFLKIGVEEFANANKQSLPCPFSPLLCRVKLSLERHSFCYASDINPLERLLSHAVFTHSLTPETSFYFFLSFPRA